MGYPIIFLFPEGNESRGKVRSLVRLTTSNDEATACFCRLEMQAFCRPETTKNKEDFRYGYHVPYHLNHLKQQQNQSKIHYVDHHNQNANQNKIMGGLQQTTKEEKEHVLDMVRHFLQQFEVCLTTRPSRPFHSRRTFSSRARREHSVQIESRHYWTILWA